MRFGLIIYGSLETISGGYLYDRKLVEYLRRQGDQVQVISLPWRGYARHLLDNFSEALRRRLVKSDFDVLLQDELNHPSLFGLNRRLKSALPYPVFSIVHHLRCSEFRPAWQNRLYRRVESSYLHSVDGYIFNSQTTRQAVHRLDPKLVDRPYVVAYPAGDHIAPTITEAEIAQRAVEPGALRLLFVGNLIPRKGLHTLLDALQHIPEDACELSVVGSQAVDPIYAQAIRRQIDQAGLAGRVRLLGALSQEELVDLLRSHQVLVVPSSYEGYGIVYLEGMGFGLPAIGATAGAAGEIITHEIDGYLIPPQASQALAEHLVGLSRDRLRLREMSLAARRRYQAQPTWNQTAGQIRGFLQSQINEYARQRHENV
jgi:glycosyltransferase involved in cell wall biosynthesis